MNQEVFQKGKLYFTKDGQAVITGHLFHNLRLSDDFVRREMPYTRTIIVPSYAFPMLQATVRSTDKDLVDTTIKMYFTK